MDKLFCYKEVNFVVDRVNWYRPAQEQLGLYYKKVGHVFFRTTVNIGVETIVIIIKNLTETYWTMHTGVLGILVSFQYNLHFIALYMFYLLSIVNRTIDIWSVFIYFSSL